jgi:small subunit ribosomal protein S17
MADENDNENEDSQDVAPGAAEAKTPADAAPATASGGKRRRAAKPIVARRPRTPEERHAERIEIRRGKALARTRRRAQEREKAVARRSKAGATTEPELPPVHAPKRGAPKERQGIVVSSKADKTITVRIDVARQHRRYEKIVRSSSTLHAHDESNDANEGDVVRVVESRPLSKTKRWRLLDVLERAR